MIPKFGTSGLRGLVTALTQGVVADYTRAFLHACPQSAGALYIGRDLRPSSGQIADWIADAARGEGVFVRDCGAVPTPALYGTRAIMVTGSHIPADRNGLKFYTPQGEITKADEARITAHLGRKGAGSSAPIAAANDKLARYISRNINGFSALTGMRIGVYQHSGVARDVLVQVLTALGAQVVALGRSQDFIPLDTEAVTPDLAAQLALWCAQHRLDCAVSTDGDADRPLVSDALGAPIAGDILGVITAQFLGADTVCTPVTSNTMIAQMPQFDLHQVRVGSPFVIAAMQAALAQNPAARVVGYEANGGFLLGFDAVMPNGFTLPALISRDAVLPILAVLSAAYGAGKSVRDLCAAYPQRFTAADKLQDIDPHIALIFMDKLRNGGLAAFIGAPIARMDMTDGLRIWDDKGRIIHLRPSGNAPEFRCYTEGESPEICADLLRKTMAKLAQALG